jgi:hypothetical protein
MENAYQPALWHDFFVVLGSSSAALIGLLFIATSGVAMFAFAVAIRGEADMPLCAAYVC